MIERKLLILSLLGTLCVQQISCQFLDYEDNDTEAVGLADGFQPSVKVSCVGGTMKIRVDTKLPFNGVIHGRNRTEPGCYVYGNSGLKTYLNIDLTKDGCGLNYNQRTEERTLALAVRAHPTIELLEDRLYKVTCGRTGFQNSRNEVSVVQLKVTLPSDPLRKIDTVLEGSRYKLRAEVIQHDPDFDITLKRCFAFDETDSAKNLVDERGCAVDRLISDFTYDKASGTAEATLYSMFRLPHSNRTYFQCDVSICKGSCPAPKCADIDEQLKLQNEGQLAPIDGIDPFERGEDDTVTTSTSVFVAQPGSAASASAVFCSGFGPGDSDWLKWLCIAFGILFGVMLLINIFLCSAMTCSCTRSEIIEKEPSVYDDYSIYDSQYGYTNNGKDYSESDYGSEYGMVENGDNTQAAMGGRLPSEYSQSHPGSTLNRTRH